MHEILETPTEYPKPSQAKEQYEETILGEFRGWHKKEYSSDKIDIWSAEGRSIDTVLGEIPAEVGVTQEGRALLKQDKTLRKQLFETDFSNQIGKGDEGAVYDLQTETGEKYVVKQVFPSRTASLVFFTPQVDRMKMMQYVADQDYVKDHNIQFNVPVIATVYQSVSRKIDNCMNAYDFRTMRPGKGSYEAVMRHMEQVEADLEDDRASADVFLYECAESIRDTLQDLKCWYNDDIKPRISEIKNQLNLNVDLGSSGQEVVNNSFVQLEKVPELYQKYIKWLKESDKEEDMVPDFFQDPEVKKDIEAMIVVLELGPGTVRMKDLPKSWKVGAVETPDNK